MTRKPFRPSLSLLRPTRWLAMLGLALPALLPLPATAQAQTQTSIQTLAQAQNDLYIDAMRSLNEGRRNDASDALARMIEREPQHAGAWLDLAIIQCELGRAEEAERLFKIIETRFSPPPIIMDVISRWRSLGCSQWQPRIGLTFMASRGFDTNVNQGASNPNFGIGTGSSRVELQLLPEYLPRSDHYTSVSLDYLRELDNNGSIGFVQGRLQVNDALAAYNTSSIAMGMERPWRFGNWSLRGTGTLAAFGLGGRLYQRQAQLQARLTPPLPLPPSWQFSVGAGVNHIEYATLEDYNANMFELRTQLNYRSEFTQAQAGVGLNTDRGVSTRPGKDRQGWNASISAKTLLPYRLTGELSWLRQTWLSEAVYSPGLIDERRKQDTQIIRGVLTYPLSKQQNLNLEVRAVKNDENISLFQYNSRQVQLSWQWQGD
ncbi:tetratricopeptide repeat protein [Noviherbaspirillum galbum]|uniref:Tetratricopeptide repeat protein n=1 Tax=Noviherbaspirillum galbum TaxID=2709383 RepID=A0A6B3SJ61_9BURK|nr:tetratricopeptide repeat protein [Noviherbaspirillum galbum]NEX60894.1 tetratricopeptide repeat protein [Noviherbaspirillum galbum]